MTTDIKTRGKGLGDLQDFTGIGKMNLKAAWKLQGALGEEKCNSKED
jgi:hypothetical protein